LSQKAYYFYPDDQVKILLHTALLYQIEKCNFEKVSDIDYLAQFSRFENSDLDAITGVFNNIIYYHLQYTNKEVFCDSLYQRLISSITDEKTIEEISFTYNMLMSYHYINSDKVEKYVTKALEIKGNYADAKFIMDNYLFRKLNNSSNSLAFLDTINKIELKYNIETINLLIKDYKLIAYLKIAEEYFDQQKISEGDKYLEEFESNCTLPIDNQRLSLIIESTYRTAAVYYYYEGNKTEAKSYVDRGLKYVPNSKFLESVLN